MKMRKMQINRANKLNGLLVLLCAVIFLGGFPHDTEAQVKNIKEPGRPDGSFNPGAYNVSRQPQGFDAKGSMPVGNGDIAAHVWMSPDGVLSLLVSKSDAFYEFNRLPKLGGLHIHTNPTLIQEIAILFSCFNCKMAALKLKPAWLVKKPVKVEAWIESGRFSENDSGEL